jgi:hypothetical protein
MHDTFSLVRPACDLGGVLPEDSAVVVVNGRMEARNAQLTVSVPCDLPDMAVPAVDLDFALRKMVDCDVSVGKSFVVLKGKGQNTRVKRLAVERQLEKPPVSTAALEDAEDLVSALDEVFPFTTGDPAKPWSVGARIDDRTVTATNSMMLLRAELSSSSGLSGVTLSRKAIEYIRLRRASLKAWGVDEKRVLLEFDDGSWASASRLNPEMPDAAVSMVDGINDWDGLMKVTGEYRAGYLSSMEYADGIVSIFPDHVFASRLSTEHKHLLTTNLGDQEAPAMFTAKDLAVVIGVADEIGFDRYPNPVPFKTLRGSSGLIAGRK